MVLSFQPISDVTVIVRGQRDLFVLDDFLFDGQFFEDIPFDLWRDDSWRGRSLILNRERHRILFILFQKQEKPTFFDFQNILNVLSFNLVLEIAVK